MGKALVICAVYFAEMKTAFVLGAILLAIPTASPAQTISGKATVIDGDTLEMPGARIRLQGIDAPEGRQTCPRDGEVWACGEEAAEMLRALVRNRDVVCEMRDRDRYGRLVAQCAADALDLAQVMVEAGLAIALPQFSDAYVQKEARARSLKLGLWSSDFQLPSDYRAADRTPKATIAPHPRPARSQTARASVSRTSDPYSGGCKIKGNRNRKGQWIYHMPGMPYYDQTRPEDIFCTEAQAQKAGYRRAIVK